MQEEILLFFCIFHHIRQKSTTEVHSCPSASLFCTNIPKTLLSPAYFRIEMSKNWIYPVLIDNPIHKSYNISSL